MSRESIEMAIADRTYNAEKRNATALGHDTLDVAMMSFGTFCEVLSLACEPDRNLVLTRFRPLTAKHPL